MPANLRGKIDTELLHRLFDIAVAGLAHEAFADLIDGVIHRLRAFDLA